MSKETINYPTALFGNKDAWNEDNLKRVVVCLSNSFKLDDKSEFTNALNKEDLHYCHNPTNNPKQLKTTFVGVVL